MSAFFKNIAQKIGKLTDAINGVESKDAGNAIANYRSSEPTAAKQSPEVKTTPEVTAQPEEPARPEQAPSESEVFDNAIDKRNRAIQYLKEEFRSATGTSSVALASLYIYVVTDPDNFDAKRYAWADDTFRSQLRLELDNAMLDAIGKRTLEIRLVAPGELPNKAKAVVDNTLYYSFVGTPRRSERVRARLTVVEGTGSLARSEYILDSAEKGVYHIGRGPMANKPGAYRPNDIVIRDNDPAADLQQRNNHVSSAHADIIASNGRFFIKALRWGCRPMGGACTKLIYDDTDHEIRDTSMRHPLADGYVIELGKQVAIIFQSLPEESETADNSHTTTTNH